MADEMSMEDAWRKGMLSPKETESYLRYRNLMNKEKGLPSYSGDVQEATNKGRLSQSDATKIERMRAMMESERATQAARAPRGGGSATGIAGPNPTLEPAAGKPLMRKKGGQVKKATDWHGFKGGKTGKHKHGF